MANQIHDCKKCLLYKNQCPLLDHTDHADVMWVGLSAKKTEDISQSRPLGSETNTGKILQTIEEQSPDFVYYHTNLVKCLPLDEKGRLRYPRKKEMELCISNLFLEIDQIKPHLIFLLGNEVNTFFQSYIKKNNLSLNIPVIKIHHPSYIYVYRRKYISDYVEGVLDQLNAFL